MLNFISSTQKINTESIRILIYGEPGIGKTSLASTSENPLLIDFDGGAQRACYRGNTVRVESWEDVESLKTSKELKHLNPKTIIIDTAGAMIDNYLADYVKRNDPKCSRRGGELSLQGYGAMKNVFSQFLNWTKSLNASVIFIAHSTIKEDDRQVPKVTGGAYDILQQESDLVGFMYSSKNKRVIDFNPTDMHIGKNCSGFDVLNIPDYLESGYKTFISSLIGKTIDKMNSLSEEAQKIIKEIDEYKEQVKELEIIEEFNKEVENLKTEDRKISIQKFQILENRSLELKFLHDKKRGFYVQD